jgi:hypothetical protein
MFHNKTKSYSEESEQRLVYMNKITQDVCKWQEEAFLVQKREFDKRTSNRTFGAGDIVYVIRPQSGHLAQKFHPKFEGPFSVIINHTIITFYKIVTRQIEPGPFTSIYLKQGPSVSNSTTRQFLLLLPT